MLKLKLGQVATYIFGPTFILFGQVRESVYFENEWT